MTVQEGSRSFVVHDGAIYNVYSVPQSLVWIPAEKTEIEIWKGCHRIGYYNFYDNITKITVQEGNERFYTHDNVLYENTSPGAKFIWLPPNQTTLEISADYDGSDIQRLIETFTTLTLAEGSKYLFFFDDVLYVSSGNIINFRYDPNDKPVIVLPGMRLSSYSGWYTFNGKIVIISKELYADTAYVSWLKIYGCTVLCYTDEMIGTYSNPSKGNVTEGNNNVSAADALSTLKIITSLLYLNLYQLWCSDADNNYRIDTNDVIKILNYCAGNIFVL